MRVQESEKWSWGYTDLDVEQQRAHRRLSKKLNLGEQDACETLSPRSYLGYLDHNTRGRGGIFLYHTLLPGPGRTPAQRVP